MYIIMYVICDSIIHKYALIVPYGSISEPEDVQEWPKHVASIMNKQVNNILLLSLLLHRVFRRVTLIITPTNTFT